MAGMLRDRQYVVKVASRNCEVVCCVRRGEESDVQVPDLLSTRYSLNDYSRNGPGCNGVDVTLTDLGFQRGR